MSYKHHCNCGKPNCNCHHHHNHFVDLSCMETQPYDDAETLLGLNNCGKVVSVEKPEPELSELDREKLDMLTVDGNGDSALYNDGTYKETYTKEQTGELIGENLKDAVFYNDRNNIEPRADVIINRNSEIRAKNSDGSEYNLVQATTIGMVNYGDDTKLTNLVSSTRPVAQLSGESITDVHPIAFVEDVVNLSEELDEFKAETAENFGKTDEKINDLSADTDKKIADLSADTNTKFDGVNTRIDNLAADTDKKISDLSADTDAKFDGVNTRIDDLSAATDADFDSVNERIDNVETSVENLKTATGASFEAVNTAIEGLGSRVATNENNITINTSDISAIRDDINAQVKFKGYYQKSAEIQVIPGESGAYAWSAETGTVWIYDGNSWVNSGDPIPDQTVDPYNGTPLMDGEANTGSSKEYSRGDHRHPTDTTRAAAADLDNYLKLAGNTQATKITGDVWLGSDKALRISDNGESYIAHNSNSQQTEIISNGFGGINVQLSAGTFQYNGMEIATLQNVGEVSNKVSEVNNKVTAIDTRVAQNESDIADLQDAVESAEHFRGYFATTAEITLLSGEAGAFAWNGQTGTVWVYKTDVPSWVDSGEAIPSETPYDALPQMDGTANAGNTREYARGNHVHPTDTSRASVTDLSALESIVSAQGTRIETAETGIKGLEKSVSDNTHRLGAAENNIVDLQTSISAHDGRFDTVEGDIINLQTSVSSHDSRLQTAEGKITDLENNVSANTGDIKVLKSTVSDHGERVTTLETNVYELQGRSSANESAITTLQGNVVTNSADIQTLVEKVAVNTTTIGTITKDVSTATGNIEALDLRVSANESGISTNASDIQGILSRLAGHEHFRGYYQTTVELTAISNPETGDYAWNGQTNTVWTYNGTTWADSQIALPDVIVKASDADPLVDGDAYAGESNEYARGDHRHPTDESRASEADLAFLKNTVGNVIDDTMSLRQDVNANTSAIEINSTDIGALQVDWLNIQSIIDTLHDDVSANKDDITGLKNRIDGAESNIEEFQNNVTDLQQNKVSNLGGVTGIKVFNSNAEAEAYSVNNPDVLAISLEL